MILFNKLWKISAPFIYYINIWPNYWVKFLYFWTKVDKIGHSVITQLHLLLSWCDTNLLQSCRVLDQCHPRITSYPSTLKDSATPDPSEVEKISINESFQMRQSVMAVSRRHTMFEIGPKCSGTLVGNLLTLEFRINVQHVY